MTIAATSVRCKLLIDNEIVKQMMEVNYLGETITSYGLICKKISCHIKKANKMSGCMTFVSWNNTFLRLKMKARIYKSRVRPNLMYVKGKNRNYDN